MFFPGFEPKKMNDEEIMRRITELQGKIYYAYAFSSSQELLDQMQMLLEALQMEQQERQFMKLHELRQRSSPDVIETEPDLKEKKVEPEARKKGGKTGGLNVFFPPKTKTPTNNGNP